MGTDISDPIEPSLDDDALSRCLENFDDTVSYAPTSSAQSVADVDEISPLWVMLRTLRKILPHLLIFLFPLLPCLLRIQALEKLM